MKNIALIQFPGSNCEQETAHAVKRAGMNPYIFRWNKPPEELSDFDGFIIPGGFSYQDRVRAGAVAAKKTIMRTVFVQALKNKPVLGICNGAQILIESGILPGISPGKVEMAVAPNSPRGGYHCGWTFLKSSADPSKCAFTRVFAAGEIIPCPVAHAEGRFTSRDRILIRKLADNGQIVLRYSSPDGKIEPGLPVNPSGSLENIAGITNPEGNVMGLMPHPERAASIRQVPDDLEGKYGDARRRARGDMDAMGAPGPGMKIFESMAQFLGAK